MQFIEKGQFMNKKRFVIVVLLVLICTALVLIFTEPAMQTNKEFNLAFLQFRYDFDRAFADATEEMRGLNIHGAIPYMRYNDLEEHIQNMQRIIDERIIDLQNWEEKFGTVYTEPFREIETMIVFEYAYRLSKVGHLNYVNFDSDEWIEFSNLFSHINLAASATRGRIVNSIHLPENQMIFTRILLLSARGDEILMDYSYASDGWRRLLATATAYIENAKIPDEKKAWIVEYMQRDPYGAMWRRLEERGISGQ